jgi:hypothetical protein
MTNPPTHDLPTNLAQLAPAAIRIAAIFRKKLATYSDFGYRGEFLRALVDSRRQSQAIQAPVF